MSEADNPTPGPANASAEFVRLEQELAQETSVLALMKEQMTSMLGMVTMFVVTIILALFIRPWYDVAELHAFGETGATQVRFILLELVMIFIFTAVVIALARYKKEWVIKYGIMGVLTIALMYTTVPLMHVLVIDFDAEDFEYEESLTYSGEYVTDLGMNGFITHELIGNSTNWQDSISYYSSESLNSTETEWVSNFSRLPAGDFENLRIVKSDDYITVANTAWIWTVDLGSGEVLENYSCNYLDNSGNIQLGTSFGDSCDMALKVEEGVYIFSASGTVTYYPLGSTGEMLAPQAQWFLPAHISSSYGFIEASQISEDRLLFIGNNAATVMELRTEKVSLSPELMPIEFEYYSEGMITSADFGHSPWSSLEILENDGNSGLLIVGEANGNISGWEWNGSKSDTNQFTEQNKMNLNGLVDTVYQVQITDLDNTGFTDLLISGDEKSYWLRTQLLKNLLTFDVDDDFLVGIFANDGSDDYFFAVSQDSIESGVIDKDMYTLDGLQLYDIPFLVGVILALLLMVLLYFHSEWYVAVSYTHLTLPTILLV